MHVQVHSCRFKDIHSFIQTETEQRGRVYAADPPAVQSAVTQRSSEVKQFDVATNKAESRREASISTFRETCRFRLSEKSDRGQGHTECFMSGFTAVSARRRRTAPWSCLRRVVWQETYMVKLLSFGEAAAAAAAL